MDDSNSNSLWTVFADLQRSVPQEVLAAWVSAVKKSGHTFEPPPEFFLQPASVEMNETFLVSQDGYKSDFEVLSVAPDYARVDAPVGLTAAPELLNTLHQYLIHKRLLPGPIDASASQAEDELASSFGSREFFHRMGTAASLKNVSSQIMALAQRTHVLMLHLRGHGSRSGFRLLDKYLTPTHIVECLKAVGFTGTVVCVLNCCHADPVTFPDSQHPVTPSVWSPDLPFKWVLISSTPREGTQVAVHGNKVTKLVAALFREQVSYSDLEEHIHRWWAPDVEDIDAWKKFSEPPRVARGGPYSGRFMEQAVAVSSSSETYRTRP